MTSYIFALYIETARKAIVISVMDNSFPSRPLHKLAIRDINELQTNIMLFIKEWIKDQNTPVPQKEIIKKMVSRGVKSYTALNAINSLLRKGYIRRGYSERANTSNYVMIRNI